MLAINMIIPDLRIARHVQFRPSCPWQINSMYEQQTWMLAIDLLNRNTDGWRTSEKVSWEKGQGPQNLQKRLLEVVSVSGHSNFKVNCKFVMSPLLGYLWFLIVIRSNDIGVYLVALPRYILSKIAKFSHPRIINGVDLHHGLTDPAIFYFPSTLRVMAFNMLRLGAKLGEIWGFRPSFLLGAGV